MTGNDMGKMRQTADIAGYVKAQELELFCCEVLMRSHCDLAVAKAVSSGLVETSLRGVDSHGIRLFPHYLKALKSGRINGSPQYSFESRVPAALLMDADHSYGHAAGRVAMERAMETAQTYGIGSVSVRNSSHSGAAACYGLIAAHRDMIGMAFTHATPLMKSPGGTRAFFGANPICFAAPMEGESPCCVDMSTTAVTWNKVKLCKERGIQLDADWAFDQQGQPTEDPWLASCLAPIGDYKGFALSAMIDILCGLLSGMPCGDQISDMYGNPISQKRFLGQFYVAISIEAFQSIVTFKRGMKDLAARVRAEPSAGNGKILFPGDPEKNSEKERKCAGIPVEEYLMHDMKKIAKDCGLSFPS